MAENHTQQDLRRRLLDCLGGDWPELEDVDLRFGPCSEEEGYGLVKISYLVEPDERVSAWLLVPEDVNADRPGPAVAVWHQHNHQWELGKSEPAGLSGDPRQHVGPWLARAGYVVLCPDALGFEDRRDEALPGDAYERFLFLRYVVEGKCLAWKNILDMRRAIDVLEQLPEVDAQRIGCFGHSMGATFTWLVGPFEPRLQCLVANCCLPTYAGIHRERIIHCYANFIPGWLRYGDTPDVAALIAPRPLWMNFGEDDAGSPIDEVRRGLETIRAAYAGCDAAELFEANIEPGVGHEITDSMWRRSLAWFDRHL